MINSLSYTFYFTGPLFLYKNRGPPVGNLSKEVWIYVIRPDGSIIKTIYSSKSIVSKVLKVQYRIITYHLDKWIKGGINGHYIFSYELNAIELKKLMEISILKKTNYIKVWAYNAHTLGLISDVFSSLYEAACYFKVDYRSISNHLNTNVATLKSGVLVYFF